MGSHYIAIPGAGTVAPIQVALVAATVKTVLQVAIPATTRIKIIGWGISFDGTVSTNDPGEVSLVDAGYAATTGTSLTVDKWGSDDAPASLCIGGAALTAYNLTAEGTPAGTHRLLDSQEVHPQAGYGIWFPDGRQPRIDTSRFLRVRANFAQVVN